MNEDLKSADRAKKPSLSGLSGSRSGLETDANGRLEQDKEFMDYFADINLVKRKDRRGSNLRSLAEN